MIGIFDSGFGGLQTLAYFQEVYPQYDYIFLADQAHYPFGTKTATQIQQYTFDGLNRLFDQGAVIVIIACNTAAAFAIKQRQANYPDKKALSITIPGMEKIQETQSNCKNITVLATEGTMKSGIYTKLFQSTNPNPGTSMNIMVASDLVDVVEQGITDETKRKQVLDKYLVSLKKQKTDCLVLGCTHFPVLTTSIQRYFDGKIIDPGLEAVQRFAPYLNRHPDIEKAITKNGQINIYTTGDPDKFVTIGRNILPSIPTVKKVVI